MEKEAIKASLDRFEEDYAVVYADDGRRFDVSRDLVPKNTREGTRVKIHVRDSKVIKVMVDHNDNEELEGKIKEKLERLKSNQHLK